MLHGSRRYQAPRRSLRDGPRRRAVRPRLARSSTGGARKRAEARHAGVAKCHGGRRSGQVSTRTKARGETGHDVDADNAERRNMRGDGESARRRGRWNPRPPQDPRPLALAEAVERDEGRRGGVEAGKRVGRSAGRIHHVADARPPDIAGELALEPVPVEVRPDGRDHRVEEVSAAEDGEDPERKLRQRLLVSLEERDREDPRADEEEVRIVEEREPLGRRRRDEAVPARAPARRRRCGCRGPRAPRPTCVSSRRAGSIAAGCTRRR